MQTSKKRKLKGLCPRCGIPWSGKTYNCVECTAAEKERAKNRRISCRDMCSRCLARPPHDDKKYCLKCLESSKIASRKITQKYRSEVIKNYGGKCVCCGNKNEKVLQLDHIYNDGKEHRKKAGTTMYKWAKRNNYPSNLQLLCANCHQIKTNHGKCGPKEHLTYS